jgi:hypothetical protein
MTGKSNSKNVNKANVYKTIEQDRSYFRELIWKNALDLFERRSGMTPGSILKTQRKFINSFNLKHGNKNDRRIKYKTVELLDTYFKSSNEKLAEQVFYNSVLKRIKE